MSKPKIIAVTLIKSLIGRKPSHIACAKGIGLKRMHQTVSIEDTPENRGMVNQIHYMVNVVETQA